MGMAESEANCAGFFEGAEKLLEIWFTRSNGNTEHCDLRNIPRQKLENMLKIVRCDVVSFLHNDQVDAYVLSESSMFISSRRFILKTCGSTTLLHCLKPLLMLVEEYAGFDEVQNVFYSRKNFMKPDLQKNPHQNFEQEVVLLHTYFKDGAAYCLGKVNADCWYLYTLNPLEGEENKREHRSVPEPDQTLEILMSDLEPTRVDIFTKKESSTAAEVTQKSGIGKLVPNMVIDDFLFDPCGYSMNGISRNGSYMTIHVTPEPEFSYASFESNVPQDSYKGMIMRILDIFQPGKFLITLFANKTSPAAQGAQELEQTSFGDWIRQDIPCCHVRDYDLTCAFYSKFPS